MPTIKSVKMTALLFVISASVLLSACGDNAPPPESLQVDLPAQETELVAEPGRSSGVVEESASVEESVDVEASAEFEKSLLKTINEISVQQLESVESQNFNELQQLSEQDRAALRDQAELELMQSAEQKALQDAKTESARRGPVN